MSKEAISWGNSSRIIFQLCHDRHCFFMLADTGDRCRILAANLTVCSWTQLLGPGTILKTFLMGPVTKASKIVQFNSV